MKSTVDVHLAMARQWLRLDDFKLCVNRLNQAIACLNREE